MTNKVRLTRITAGQYEAWVRPMGCSRGDPVLLTVNGPDPLTEYKSEPGYDWCVESDREQFFSTLKEARIYINRFFENARG